MLNVDGTPFAYQNLKMTSANDLIIATDAPLIFEGMLKPKLPDGCPKVNGTVEMKVEVCGSEKVILQGESSKLEFNKIMRVDDNFVI